MHGYDQSSWKGSYQASGQIGTPENPTLFTTAGIYYSHSTDGGVTWSPWQTVASTVNDNGVWTMDHPRIACRRDYGDWVNDVPGCISWEHRRFTKNQDYSITVNETHVGMAFYNTDGTIYPITGTDNYAGIATESNPQRPNIAVSPDGQIWLSYYVVTNWTNANADYYVQSGTVSIGGSPTIKSTVSFTTTNMKKVASSQILPGYYDKYRGYFFNEESQLYPDFNVEFAQGPSIQVADTNIYQCYPTYTVGFAYTRNDVLNNPYVDGASTDANRWLSFWYASVPFGGAPQNVTWNERDKLNWIDDGWQMSLFPVLKYATVIDPKHYSGSPDGGNSAGQIAPERRASYFILSYLRAKRCKGDNMGGNTLDYMQAQTGISFDNTFSSDAIFQKAEPDCVDNPLVALSLDNLGTQIGACGEQGSLQIHTAWHRIIVGDCDASERLLENNGGAIIAQTYLDGYPYNDPNAYANSSSGLTGTVFNATGDKSSGNPYHYFNFDGISQPTNITITTSTTTSPSPTAGIQAGLGNFAFDQFVPSISSSPVPYGVYWAHYTADQSIGKTDYGTLNTSDQRKIVMTENIAHAVFEDNGIVYYSEGMPDFATLDDNNREWTQPIAIGGMPQNGAIQTLPAIAVYEEDSADAIRDAEIALGNQPGSALVPESPDRYSGKSSIAITWTELTPVNPVPGGPVTAVIKIRTREFNACTGQWYDWGSPQTIYNSAPQGGPITTYEMSNTCDGVSTAIPVSTVAPLVAPTLNPQGHWQYASDPEDPSYSAGYYTFLPTNLIGWVTTWSDDNGDVNDVLSGPIAIRSRTLLRAAHTDNTITNTNWGTYGSTLVPSIPPYYNPLYSYSEPQGIGTTCDFFSYISSTSQENKGEDSIVASVFSPNSTKPVSYQSNPRAANYQIDVAFSNSDGYLYNNGWGAWGLATASANYGMGYPGGLAYGQWDGNPLTVFTPFLYQGGISANNPEITVNSSGQQFLAWQGIVYVYNPPYYTQSQASAISVQSTVYESSWSNSMGYTNPVTTFDEDIQGHGLWLRDPSIAGLPKGGGTNVTKPPTIDADLGFVDLMFWQQHDSYGNLVNNLRRWYYYEAPYQAGVPNSDLNSDGGWFENGTASGTNPQLSFGPLQSGEGLSLGNSTSAPPPYLFNTAYIGAYKLGVFDSTQDFTEYRSEARRNDSAAAKFVWGDAKVTEPGDTTGEQIELAYGVDTGGWHSHSEIRDSLFQTRPFVLALGAYVSYFRGGYVIANDSLAAVNAIGQTDSMRFYIEMVHANGHIDTLERLVYAPGAHAYLIPSTINTQPSLAQTDTVYLRVQGAVSGFSDADSLCSFANEIDFGHHASIVDSTLAMKRAIPFATPSETALQVLPIYPNPIMASGGNATIILSCPKGLTSVITIVDATGQVMSEPLREDGTGRWQTYSISVPKTGGDYFIHVSDGIDSRVLPVSIIR